jgi:hemerythrin-like domain-containing protein
MNPQRRQFVSTGAALSFGALGFSSNLRADDREADNSPDDEVTPAEDLMREHGILNRILLIYEEGLRRLDDEGLPPDVYHKPATLVRKFVEDYHEKLEENFIFPEFERRKVLVDLVKVLREQHQVGRKATDVILHHAQPDEFRKGHARNELISACRAFIRMYRPHEAREDTVLFPALRTVIDADRLKELGERFEEQEDRLFGDEGFERTVDEVAAIEKNLGIYDLAQFTAGSSGSI